MPAKRSPLLDVRGLKMHFPIPAGLFGKVAGYVKAADDVSFQLYPGETLGLVGESGCGKTTVGRCLIRAYAPTAGQLFYQPMDGAPVDLAQLSREELQPYRTQIRMIFQDPYSSLNPRMTVFEVISEVLRANTTLSATAMEERVAQMLRQVGLRPEYMRRYPHAFSGGERQRIVIARALITEPRLILADEAVSALDVSVRAQILNLMEDLRTRYNLTYLFVSHDLSVVRYLCDRVIVMYVGKVAEIAPVDQLFQHPKHPYTEALLSSVPIDNPRQRTARARIRLEGEVADPSHPPSGCYFHPRCRYAQERCRTETPPLLEVTPGHWSACHFAKELELVGAEQSNPHG
ncbi:MAG: ATP-binding cassette domain-containing protein [Caldilineaceae bacterium]|nr:ATP-binding cassette domain-containing protein [Caldilineaceae bacterium]